MSGNPFDTGATATRQARSTHETKLREAGGKNAFVGDMGENFKAENLYTPGALLARVAEIAVGKTVELTLGEEDLGPQPA